ncbi:trans-sialidase [Trypanosoma cruzi]|nr:trans-sialidase [Trypanosoma cruzi]
MSRRVITSAVLLLLVMMCCGTGGAAQAAEPTIPEAPVPKSSFGWRDTTGDETVSSLRGPSLVEVNGKVFAVAEAQCKNGETSVFTGIASRLLTMEKGNEPKDVLKEAKVKTQILEEGGSGKGKKVDVSRPTTVVNGSDIHMLVGKHSHEDLANCQVTTETINSGILLVKGEVVEDGNKVNWNDTDGVPCTLGEKHESLSQLIGGGGSGVKLKDGTLVFPVEATKKKNEEDKDVKAVSLIIYSLKDATNWTLSKGMSDDGCSDPSVVEWEKDKLMMMTACDDGRRRVYEIGDKGDSWTEALGTLSRVWASKQKGKVEIVGSGFITAALGDGDDKRNVMLVTLPVYSKEEGNGKGVLHLWLTDNTHIVDIGSVSGKEDDVAASSLLYKSGNNKKEEELIALYEKKGDGEKPSPGMVSVRLTEQLQRVKEVLTTWKKVDDRVSKLCPTENAEHDSSTDDACSTTDKITDGLVGFLSGNFSDGTWRDEYLGVNATVNENVGAEPADNGVKFTGHGAGAEWPVGKRGDNQLYHFANYNFTLVATVSIDEALKSGSHITLIGAKMDDNEKSVLVGLSYNNKEKKWILLCDGRENKEHSSHLETENSEHVVILLRNGNQGSVYVDGQRVGDAQLDLKDIKDKKISHFYIGGDEGSAEGQEGQEGVSVTVSNVLLYNRPWTSEEIAGLAKNKITISKPEGPKTSMDTQSSATSGSPVQGAVSLSNSARQLPSEQETLKENIGADGVSGAASVTTPSADANTPASNGEGKVEPAVKKEMSVSSGEDAETVGGTDVQEGIHPQAGEVNATALNSSLGHLSQGNNSDGGTVRGSGLLPSLLLLLGLWGFAAL